MAILSTQGHEMFYSSQQTKDPLTLYISYSIKDKKQGLLYAKKRLLVLFSMTFQIVLNPC